MCECLHETTSNTVYTPPESLTTLEDQIVDPGILVRTEIRDAPKVHAVRN